jgi:uncharacterized RDD family membrane protein YckC
LAFCNQCRQEFLVGEERCSNCGAPLPKAHESIHKLEVKDLSTPTLKRFVAGLIDILLVLVIFCALFFYRKLMIAIIFRRGLAFFIPHLYLLFKDSIEGKSFGKLIVGIMVFNNDEKKPGGILDSVIRNWYLAIPFIGPTVLAFVIGVQLLTGKQRLGDKGAGTIVITDSDYQRLV